MAVISFEPENDIETAVIQAQAACLSAGVPKPFKKDMIALLLSLGHEAWQSMDEGQRLLAIGSIPDKARPGRPALEANH